MHLNFKYFKINRAFLSSILKLFFTILLARFYLIFLRSIMEPLNVHRIIIMYFPVIILYFLYIDSHLILIYHGAIILCLHAFTYINALMINRVLKIILGVARAMLSASRVPDRMRTSV